MVSTVGKTARHVLFGGDSSSATGLPLALSSHSWFPVAVACNNGHTLGTRFGELAKPGEGSRWVSNPRWVRVGQRPPYGMRRLTPGGTSGRAHVKIQRLWRRWQQVSLERLDQDKVTKEVLVIHCRLAVSSRNGSPCHWIKTSKAKREGLPLCTGLLYKNFTHRSVWQLITHHRLPICLRIPSSPAAINT